MLGDGLGVVETRTVVSRQPHPSLARRDTSQGAPPLVFASGLRHDRIATRSFRQGALVWPKSGGGIDFDVAWSLRDRIVIAATMVDQGGSAFVARSRALFPIGAPAIAAASLAACEMRGALPNLAKGTGRPLGCVIKRAIRLSG